MLHNISKSILSSALVILCGSVAQESIARPNITEGKRAATNGLLRTTASCRPAEATIDLDINNVRAKLMTGGDLWWDRGTGEARYEIPKGSRKNSLFAGSVWVGGIDAQGQLKVAAQTYRQDGNDYWPGPLNELDAPGSTTIEAAICSDWDRFWKVEKTTINRFRELSKAGNTAALNAPEFDVIWQWPARGNGAIAPFLNGNFNSSPTDKRALGTSGQPLVMDDRDYAPFVNNTNAPNNNLLIYEPLLGDYPGIPDENFKNELPGDQYIWWVFNDKGNIKQQSRTEAIGLEVQAAAFAFSAKNNLNDMTFYDYKLINRSTSSLDSTFIATWTDADLGYYKDDYIGCDIGRGLGILYNGTAVDGQGEANSYGNRIPMVGVDFFRGPIVSDTDANGTVFLDTLGMEAFTYYNNNADAAIGNPDNGVQIYFYMTGSLRNGQPFVNDKGGACTGITSGNPTKYVFPDEPSNLSGWSECACGNPPDDRRFIHSSGPFKLQAGAVQDITIAVVWAADAGGCPNTSFRKIKSADDLSQNLFDNYFQTIAGPEAPRLVIRELDKKLVLYLVNDGNSNNYQEKFGYGTDSAKYRVVSPKARNANAADLYYKFEGYRIFQVKNKLVQAAQIVDETGKVNEDVAREIFQTDIQNGISQIVNYERITTIDNCDSCYQPIVKVNGKDSGIVHSFLVENDAFAEGRNQSLVNYRNYYFIAVAYAHNNFALFNSRFPEITQDVVYLESEKAAGGSELKVITAMPNPAYGDFGTTLNADYGSGVIIKKLAGIGNGGNVLQLSSESENTALSLSGIPQATQPTYNPNMGPVDIKIVDPLVVKPGNWELYIIADTSKPAPYVYTGSSVNKGFYAGKSQWMLIKDGNVDTIYSERNLDAINQQILEKYGLSLSIRQQELPGEDFDGNNGYITSNVSFTNPNIAWLAGVPDGEDRSPLNWIRSGNNKDVKADHPNDPCDYNDLSDDPNQRYENMIENNVNMNRTWAPYTLGVATPTFDGVPGCGFQTVKPNSYPLLFGLMGVDVVFTSDRSKWSRTIVLETEDFPSLAENGAPILTIRRHASWTGNVDDSGIPVYGTLAGDAIDSGMSWFPGYAINQETGERLNIVFGEDSWLKAEHGADMLWNPTSNIFDNFGNNVFAGRHYVYVTNERYDSCRTIALGIKNSSVPSIQFQKFMWTNIPALNVGYKLLSPADGFIPTDTRVRLRVTRPYAKYVPPGVDIVNGKNNDGYPYYTFNTNNLVPTRLSDAGNPYSNDKQKLLDQIQAVPNPYYAYTAYEQGRLDTRVRIINLPQKASVAIYSLDGSLIRRLTKDNVNQAYIDWDIRNAKGLQIASGMYLIHVEADGIGETIIKWFGAMRPVDISTY